jgi:hypothetical protein
MAENPYLKDQWVIPNQPAGAQGAKPAAPSKNPYLNTPQAPSVIDTLKDAAWQGYTGTMEGLIKSPGTILGDLPMWLGNVGRKGYDRIMRLNAEDKGRPAPAPTALSDEQLARAMRENPIGSESVRSLYRNQLNLADPSAPKTNVGRYARTAGEFLGGSIPTGGASSLTTAGQTVLGGLAFQGARDAFPESSVAPLVAAVGAPLLVQGIASGASAMVPRIDPKRAAQTRYLMSQGVPVYPGQAASNPFIQNLWDMSRKTSLFGNQAAEKQAAAFTRAAARTMGANTDDITQSVLDSTQRRLGGKLESLYKNAIVPADDELINALAGIDDEAARALQPAQRGYIQSALNEAVDVLAKHPNGVPGDVFWNMIMRNSKSALSNALDSTDPKVAAFGRAMRDAMEDSLSRNSPSGIQPAISQAKGQYRNMMILKRPAQLSGTDEISPGGLLNRVVNETGGVRGTLGALGKAGKNVLKPVPSSGTAERLLGAGLVSSAGGTMAGLAAGTAGLPAAGGAALAASIPMGTRGLLESQTLMRMMLQKAADRARAMQGARPAPAGLAPPVGAGIQAVGAMQRPPIPVQPGLLAY